MIVVVLPGSAGRVTFGGTVSTGGSLSARFDMCVPITTWTSSKVVVAGPAERPKATVDDGRVVRERADEEAVERYGDGGAGEVERHLVVDAGGQRGRERRVDRPSAS